MTDSHLDYVADGRALRVETTPPAVVADIKASIADASRTVNLVHDLMHLDSATGIADRKIGADLDTPGPGTVYRPALDNVLYALRVALVNPSSGEARSLMRAVARFDGIRQPIPADPDRLDEHLDVASRPANGPRAA